MKINSCFCFSFFFHALLRQKENGAGISWSIANNNNVYGFDYEIFRFNFMELNGGKRLTRQDCNV